MTERHPPRRVRVVLADRRPSPLPVLRAAEVAEQTELGRELVRGLIRAACCVFADRRTCPGIVRAVTRDVRDSACTAGPSETGVPVAWWLLGLLAYPVLYLLARLHRRQAERIERDFTELLGRG